MSKMMSLTMVDQVVDNFRILHEFIFFVFNQFFKFILDPGAYMHFVNIYRRIEVLAAVFDPLIVCPVVIR